ncbi:MAG: YncE family protein [Ginsengibacter sp.]
MNRIISDQTFPAKNRNYLQQGFSTLFAVSLFVVLVVFTGTGCIAQRKTLLALSKGDHTLAIVDATTLKVLLRVPVGVDPHEVIASPDGKTAYVSIYGGGSFHEINIIDLVAQKPLLTVDTRPLFGPHGLAFADGKVWFSAEGSKAVGRYDPATNKVDWCMGTGQDRSHMVYVTADAKKIYTTNVNAGTVSILASPDKPSNDKSARHREWMQTVVPVSKGCEGFDVSPDGRWLWTASAGDGSIAIIDLSTNKVSSIIDAKVLGANRLVFTPDGKRVLVSSLREGYLYVIDVASHKEVKRIKIGKGGAGILVDPDGSRAFVGCSPDNYVAVVDLNKMEMVGQIDVGGNPDGLAWAVIP